MVAARLRDRTPRRTRTTRRAAPRSRAARARASRAARRPQIVTVAALCDAHRGRPPALDRGVRERAPFEQLAAQRRDVRVVAALEIIAHAGLHVHRRRHVVRLLAQQQPFVDRARRDQPAQPQRRRDRLRERREVDHVLGVAREQRRRRRPHELAVRIVLDDRDAVALRQHDQPVAPVGVHRHAGGVVDRRHRVDEARPARAQDRLDVVDAHPVLVDRHRDRAQAGDLEDLQRARIRRRFHDDLVARLGERLRDERDPLRRPGQHEHVAHVDPAAARAHALGDRFAQRPEAFAVAVREHEAHVAARARERAREVGERRRIGGRHALHERDQVAVLARGQLAQHRRKLADAPGRQRHPPRHAGRAVGAAAVERGDARAGADALRDQAVGGEVAIGVDDRRAVDARARSASARSGGSRVPSGRAPARICSRSRS